MQYLFFVEGESSHEWLCPRYHEHGKPCPDCGDPWGTNANAGCEGCLGWINEVEDWPQRTEVPQ
jgi:hypothetical protein